VFLMWWGRGGVLGRRVGCWWGGWGEVVVGSGENGEKDGDGLDGGNDLASVRVVCTL